VRTRKLIAFGGASAVLALIVSLLTAIPAQAHGAVMQPGSRTFLCWESSLSDTGQIIPTNPACQAALDHGGATPYYNWFAVLRSDGAGRTEGFIPDGQLCSGGTGGPYNFTGFNLPRNDWPVTHLTAGSTIQIRYNNWAAHPGRFDLYITNGSYQPTQPLTWANLEDQPFDSVVNPPSNGGPGSADHYYYWNAQLPSGLSGRHIIYSVWTRSDSTETFYGCSDVVFDGGNGEVTLGG
jgi:predicted carbohydrate-binding protein with CBM5 and CBM33 domain